MEDRTYLTDRHYSVGTDNNIGLKENISKIHGPGSRQSRFIGELEKMLGDEKLYQSATQKFKNSIKYRMKTPQNADGLVDEFVNSGYIGALERLTTNSSAKDLDYFTNYAASHNMTVPQAVLFGPNGTARRAFKDWRKQEALGGQHRSNCRPQNPAMARSYDNAFYNTRHIPRNKNKRGDIEDMEFNADASRLPGGIESQISKAFGRYRQLYIPNSKPILPTTRQGYYRKWPLPLSKVFFDRHKRGSNP